MILINETILSDNFTEFIKEDSTKETQSSPETSNLEIDDNNGKITGNILKKLKCVANLLFYHSLIRIFYIFSNSFCR